MIKRLVLVLLLAAISGALVFGAVHRTGHVLASEGRDSGTVQTEGHGTGQGQGTGQGHGAGQGHGSRSGQAGSAAVDTFEGAY